MSHTHWEGGPPCRFPTKKACEDNKADWDAMQQVILAHRIVARSDGKPYRGSGVFEQLTQMVAGARETIVNDEGVESRTPFTQRLIKAFRRYVEQGGPGPGNHLYGATQQEVQDAGPT